MKVVEKKSKYNFTSNIYFFPTKIVLLTR